MMCFVKPVTMEISVTAMYSLFISLLLYNIVSVHASECSTRSPVKFTIISRRNQTGHWISQMQLEHGTRPDPDTRPYQVEVEQSTVRCGSGEENIQISALLTAPPPRASPGYELFPGVGYYKFHSKSATWPDAKRICVQEGAHLAIINSEQESNILKELFKRYPKLEDVTFNDFAFIGFHDLYQEGTYLTIYDEALSSTGFTRWGGHQPDDAGGNEDCGSVHRDGSLNDLICSKKHAFICEQEL